MMNGIIAISNPRVYTPAFKEITLHRAITQKEVLKLCSKYEIKFVLIEHNVGDDIDWISNLNLPHLVITQNPNNLPLVNAIVPGEVTEEYLTNLFGDVAKETPPPITGDNAAQVFELAQKIETLQQHEKDLQAIVTDLEKSKQEETEKLTKEIQLSREQLDLIKEQGQSDTEVVEDLKQQIHTLQDALTTMESEVILHKETLTNRLEEERNNHEAQLQDLQRSWEATQETTESSLSELKAHLHQEVTTKQGLIDSYDAICQKFISLKDTVKNYLFQMEEMTGDLENKDTEIATYQETLETTKLQVTELSLQLEQLNDLRATLENEIVALKNNNNEATILDLENQLKLKDTDIQVMRLDREQIENDLTFYKAEYEKVSTDIQSMKLQLLGYQQQQQQMSSLQSMESELNARIIDLVAQKSQVTSQLIIKEQEVQNLTSELELSKKEIALMSQKDFSKTNVQKKQLISTYKGRAKIISCVGMGSYGKSLLAYSLAHSLSKSKVLLVDFDICNPSLDSWVFTTPGCDLPEIADPIFRTGMGGLVMQGAAYVDTHLDKVLKSITPNISYFSGIYGDFNRQLLYDVDYDQFLASVGSRFDYIILDCGRLGSSLETDTLIKSCQRVSHKTLVVSLNDALMVRNTALKLKGLSMTSNLIWVLNLSNVSAITEQVQGLIGTAPVIVIPKDIANFGAKKPMTSLPLLKDKLLAIQKII